jgi:predicted amidohydrolase YtcJ
MHLAEARLCKDRLKGACAMHAEDVPGSIEIGELADFVVVNKDYVTMRPTTFG